MKLRLKDIKFPLQVEAGRSVVDANGNELFVIQRDEKLNPSDCDELTHRIVSLLNQSTEEWKNILEWTQSRNGSHEALEEALDTIGRIAEGKVGKP